MRFLVCSTARISRTEVYCLRAGALSSSMRRDESGQTLISVLVAVRMWLSWKGRTLLMATACRVFFLRSRPVGSSQRKRVP
jgi:hypothetical protein